MVTEKKAIYLMILCTIFTSLGQIFWKYGVVKIDPSHYFTFFNFPFMLGFFSYGISGLFMLSAFKKGELSILYPIIATSYVWIALISPILFPTDSYTVWNIVGVGVILISVSMLGFGRGEDTVKEVVELVKKEVQEQ